MAGDPMRLRQVLVNLVGNAIKFTEAGEVSIAVACEAAAGAAGGSELRIEVRDTGVGMTAAQLARIFRPFTQADESTTRKFGGTGLGLSISSRLIALMGGTIAVESEPGQGSAFHVRLPVVDSNAKLSALTSSTLPPPSPITQQADSPAARGEADTAIPAGTRILLVEDSPDMQRLLSMLLRRAGMDVTLAANGRVAIERATAETFDVILMDMQMPEVDGYCATTELRRRGATVPIIALTAHAMSGDREKCLAAGCSDYLTKPVEPADLIRVIARHLARRAVAAA
jgi:CheY-like chemotaxis protein